MVAMYEDIIIYDNYFHIYVNFYMSLTFIVKINYHAVLYCFLLCFECFVMNFNYDCLVITLGQF